MYASHARCWAAVNVVNAESARAFPLRDISRIIPERVPSRETSSLVRLYDRAMLGLPDQIEACLFDLEGVLTQMNVAMRTPASRVVRGSVVGDGGVSAYRRCHDQ